MTREELMEMIAAEEKRLGVGSAEFMERHREIMEMIARIRDDMKKISLPEDQSDKDK